MGGGWSFKMLPLHKEFGGGGCWKSFSQSEGGGGHTKFWGSFYMVVLK